MAYSQVPAGCGLSTVLPDMDFETYSEAGYVWNDDGQKWDVPKGATKKGFFAVGTVAYAEHPSTEVLSLAYDLKDGLGPRLWVPGMAPPEELFEYLRLYVPFELRNTGLLPLIEAHNSSFEWWIWQRVCHERMGWPELSFQQLRCSAAKARAYALPGSLAPLAKVLDTADQKIDDGKRLINKFSCPRKPTKKDPRKRIRPEEDPTDAVNLYDYNIGDTKAEGAVSALIPDLPPEELDFWLCTQESNIRGVALDMLTVHAGVGILDRALVKYNAELHVLTGGTVVKASEVQKLTGWLGAQGVHMRALDVEAVDAALARTDLPPVARRALEIRQRVGSASVKKYYAMQRQASREGRAHELFIYHRARTGRDGGADIQPQNLPKAGPKLRWCENAGCEKPYGQHLDNCPHCGTSAAFSRAAGWSWEAVDHAIEIIRTGDLEYTEHIYGDALLTLSGCIRGLFTAAPGHDLICSDYSSIEAVVTAVLAGEEWRIEAFRRGEDIYLVSASRITGIPYEEYIAYREKHGVHHPDRQKIGKPAELGLGFGGWLGAWRQFDKSTNFTDEEVKENIKAWRTASPNIVEMWGGQIRGKPWSPDYYELFGLEGAAIQAVQNPGTCYRYRLISFGVKNDTLFCRLPSGRFLTYHRPRLNPATRWDGQVELTFEGWNSNPKMGSFGWVRLPIYGGRWFENIVQGVARDILAHAVVNLHEANYPIVIRVHDEPVAEVPEGFGSIEEFEAIMATMPAWAEGWPIRAAGGWRAKRYRKD